MVEKFNIKFQNGDDSFIYHHAGDLNSAMKYAESKLHSDFIWGYYDIRMFKIFIGRTLVYESKRD